MKSMKKMISMLIATMCFAAGSLNSVEPVSATEEGNGVSFLMGDVNDDNFFNVADVVLFQKWLLIVPDMHLSNWKAADFYEDDRLDLFDLALMKRALIEELNGSPELEEPEVREILFGYSDAAAGDSKPMSEIRIAMKCKAFCPSGDTLKVDVARLGISQPQVYEGNKFLYKYDIHPLENWKQIEDDRLVVNGETGRYEKTYFEDDRLMFNVGIEYDDYSTYHHEVAELDFQKYTAGSSGCIAFSFIALFYNDDGILPEHPDTEGCGQSLYFYVGEDGVGISNSSVEDAEKMYQTKGTEEVTTSERYTGRWHRKNISYGLYEALKNSVGETIPIKVSLTGTGANEFVYQGKTLREYTNDLFGEDISKLKELLEQGDIIKYGEDAYTTGTPDGIVWTKAMYDCRVEFFGEELLSKYIVDGEFLKEQLQTDLTELKEYYRATHDEAVDAFYEAQIEETIKLLDMQGIRGERIPGTHDMLMYVSAAEFETFYLENASSYYLFGEDTVFF